MANKLRIKRRASGVPGAPGTLENAELAFNEIDDILYYGKGTGGIGGTATTIEAIAGAIKANVNSPAFTGIPTAPTAAGGTSTTQLATTAFVAAAVTAGSVADGDKGDIVVSGSGTVWTIDSGVVSNAKLATVPTATFKGRSTAGTGAPEDLTVAQAKTLLNITGTNSGDQTISLTGDVTGSGTGSFAATIAADAVTNAKLANMAANTIKGNNTAGTVNPVDLTATQVKTMLSLDQVNNTSDANKPVSTAQATAIGLKIDLTQKGAANGVATLDSASKIPSSQLPAIAISDTFVVASQAAMLALSTADVGDVAVRTDLSKSFILVTSPASTLGNWQELLTPADNVSSVFSRTGAVTAQSGDYTVAQVTGAAPLASPTFTGTPDAPTAATATNTTQLATTAFVQANNALNLKAASNLSDLANTTTARSNLGLGTMAIQNANAVAITGGTIDGITLDGGTF